MTICQFAGVVLAVMVGIPLFFVSFAAMASFANWFLSKKLTRQQSPLYESGTDFKKSFLSSDNKIKRVVNAISYTVAASILLVSAINFAPNLKKPCDKAGDKAESAALLQQLPVVAMVVKKCDCDD